MTRVTFLELTKYFAELRCERGIPQSLVGDDACVKGKQIEVSCGYFLTCNVHSLIMRPALIQSLKELAVLVYRELDLFFGSAFFPVAVIGVWNIVVLILQLKVEVSLILV